jgi:hypothetical protein
MAEDQKDLRLEAMLDSLLSTYAAAEPRPGLELRIRASLRARAAQRRRVWILMAAGAAAVVVVAAMMTQLRPSRPTTPANVAVVMTPSAVVPPHPTVPLSGSSKVSRVAAGPRPSEQASATNRVLLQAANVMTGDLGDPGFEQERLYIAPVQQSAEMPTSAPSITIQDLGVESLEIKELPSGKNTDSKGDL